MLTITLGLSVICLLCAAPQAKQTVDVAACDALEHAVADCSKMYLPAE